MAEAAAALWAAEEVVTTGGQAAIAGYMLTKPTMPLKATFTQIATSSDDDTRCVATCRLNSILSAADPKQALTCAIRPLPLSDR